MIIGHNQLKYEWIDNWATIPDSTLGKENGRTHGVAVASDGRVVVFHQASPAVLLFNPDGSLDKAWGDFPGAHGLTLVIENGQDFLWLTDQDSKQVVKATLDGKIVMEISQPPHDVYKDGGAYIPTWVAVNQQSRGGNGDIWVADGYGSHLVHRHDSKGNYISTISGQLGAAGKFSCPHGIAFDFRRSAANGNELYVADRGNQRVQVFDSEGNFRRALGAKTLHSPCMFDFQGDFCLVPELFARVDILDKDDQVVAILGDNGQASTIFGWPNHNTTGHPELIQAGLFNSPHAACFGPGGEIYIVEWIIGGRITRLKPVSQ